MVTYNIVIFVISRKFGKLTKCQVTCHHHQENRQNNRPLMHLKNIIIIKANNAIKNSYHVIIDIMRYNEYL